MTLYLSLSVTQMFDSHCSPYTITIFVSTPPHGKIVAKADLIFEEYSNIFSYEFTS